MEAQRTKKQARHSLQQAGYEIMCEIESIKARLEECRLNFEQATDEDLIDCYIYEIHALNKRYRHFLRLAKESGLVGFDARRA